MRRSSETEPLSAVTGPGVLDTTHQEGHLVNESPAAHDAETPSPAGNGFTEIDGDRLFARITIGLRVDGRTEAETAVLTLRNEKIAVQPPGDVRELAVEGPRARTDSFDSSKGLGRLRWSDTRETLERGVAGSATWKGSGSGQDSGGKKVKWGAGLAIPTFLMIFKGDSAATLWFSAFIQFGKNLRVSAVTLHPYAEGDNADF